MTAKLTASWDINSCDACGALNNSDSGLPTGWSVLVSDDGETMTHRAYCPGCFTFCVTLFNVDLAGAWDLGYEGGVTDATNSECGTGAEPRSINPYRKNSS